MISAGRIKIGDNVGLYFVFARSRKVVAEYTLNKIFVSNISYFGGNIIKKYL